MHSVLKSIHFKISKEKDNLVISCCLFILKDLET